MDSNQLFANGRLAVMSTKLFGADKFNRLADCSCLAEAVRVLSELGYGNGAALDNPNDYECLLVAELDTAMRDFKELCCDRRTKEYFFAVYDFVNAKALMKAKYMRTDGLPYCFTNATYDVAKMQQDFVQDNYGDYYAEMAEACDYIDGQFADGNRTPQVIDVALDKAAFACRRKRARTGLLKRLYVWQADTANLLALARCKRAGADRQAFEQLLVGGGKVSKDVLLQLWGGNGAELCDSYKAFWNLLNNGNVSEAEALQSKTTRAILAEGVDELSVQPAINYFAAKQRETDVIRFILISIKNGVDKERIKQFFA